MRTDEVTYQIIGAAMEVHSRLGPGLLESTYELCLMAELDRRRLSYLRQHPLGIRYDDRVIEVAYRLDLLVENSVVVEVKSVAALDRVHIAQVLTYLKLSGCRTGLLINFNVASLREGIRRLVL